jgi:hypothetical protein
LIDVLVIDVFDVLHAKITYSSARCKAASGPSPGATPRTTGRPAASTSKWCSRHGRCDPPVDPSLLEWQVVHVVGHWACADHVWIHIVWRHLSGRSGCSCQELYVG